MKKSTNNQALADAAAKFIAKNTEAPRADGKPHKKATAKKGKRSSSKKTKASKATPKRSTKLVAGILKLPAIGSKLTRTYQGKDHVVEVTADGFRYGGETFTSLTALAKKITGYKAISGPAFFGLWRRAEAK